MVVQEHRKYLYFIHIPKTAGTYVTSVLGASLGDRFVREGHCVLPNMIYPWFDRAWFTSIFGQVARYECVSFTVVRNPFDLLVSMYTFGFPYWSPRWANESQVINWPFRSFREYLYSLCKWPDYPWIYPPQKKSLFFQLFDEKGEFIPDYVIRQEYLMEGLSAMLQEIGVDAVLPFGRVNISKARRDVKYQDFYDHELKELVEKSFQGDLEFFGYNFDGHDGRVLFTLRGLRYDHRKGSYYGELPEVKLTRSSTIPSGVMMEED
jgi:hypothetical protein